MCATFVRVSMGSLDVIFGNKVRIMLPYWRMHVYVSQVLMCGGEKTYRMESSVHQHVPHVQE